jgi:hypothetical protein
VEAAEGRTAHNNGWNGANGIKKGNHVFDVVDTIPLIPVQLLPPSRPPLYTLKLAYNWHHETYITIHVFDFMKISFFGPNLLAAFSMCFFPSQTMK